MAGTIKLYMIVTGAGTHRPRTISMVYLFFRKFKFSFGKTNFREEKCPKKPVKLFLIHLIFYAGFNFSYELFSISGLEKRRTTKKSPRQNRWDLRSIKRRRQLLKHGRHCVHATAVQNVIIRRHPYL